MKNKYDKMLIVPAVLLLIYMLYYNVFEVIMGHQAIISAAFILSFISGIAITLYCLIFQQNRIGNIFYYIGFGACAFYNLYYMYFDFVYELDSIFIIWDSLYLAICIFMIVIKNKIGKSTLISGAIIYGVYAVFWGILVCTGYASLNIIYLAEIIAYAFIWFRISQQILQKQKLASKPSFTILQEELQMLNRLFESGDITEEEYNEKRKEVLKRI